MLTINRKSDFPIDAILHTDFSWHVGVLKEYGETFIYNEKSPEVPNQKMHSYAWIINQDIKKDLKTPEISIENIKDLLDRRFGKFNYILEFVRQFPE